MYSNLTTLCKNSGFENNIKLMQQSLKNEILIATTPATADLPVGSSKLGGMPDLPADLAWPDYMGMPMSFLGQLCMDDIAPHDMDDLLPKTGLFAFFYDKDEDWASSEDQGKPIGCRVLYMTQENNQLQRRPFPDDLPKMNHFHECSLAFSHCQVLPMLDGEASVGVDPTDEQYMNVLAQLRWSTLTGDIAESCFDGEHAIHALLGYTMPVQSLSLGDDSREWVRLMSNDPLSADAPLLEGENWHLLCAFDTDENTGMQWGDAGKLFFFITDEDLRQRCFDRVWYCKDCY